MPPAALAQLGRPSTPVAGLPSPPAWEHYLLESPWIAAGSLVLLGLIAFWALRRAGPARPAFAALAGAAGLGVGLIAAALLVQTERERLIERTRDLVGAAAAADTGTLEGMLDDPITFWAGSEPLKMSREAILRSVSDTLGGPYRLKDHSAAQLQAIVDSRIIARTQVRVRARTREALMYDLPVGSWWRIDWRRAGDRPDGPWLVTGLTLLQLDLVDPPERVRAYLRQ